MQFILITLLIILIILASLILYFSLQPKRKPRKPPFVPPNIAKRSRRILRELNYIFIQRFRRHPNKNELIRLIIITSHIVIIGKGWWGHWMRGKIRILLASEFGIWYGRTMWYVRRTTKDKTLQRQLS